MLRSSTIWDGHFIAMSHDYVDSLYMIMMYATRIDDGHAYLIEFDNDEAHLPFTWCTTFAQLNASHLTLAMCHPICSIRIRIRSNVFIYSVVSHIMVKLIDPTLDVSNLMLTYSGSTQEKKGLTRLTIWWRASVFHFFRIVWLACRTPTHSISLFFFALGFEWWLPIVGLSWLCLLCKLAREQCVTQQDRPSTSTSDEQH